MPLIKWAPPGQRLLLSPVKGRIIGAQRNETSCQKLYKQSDNGDHPKRKIRSPGDSRPLFHRDGEDHYQLYLVRPSSSSPQSGFYQFII